MISVTTASYGRSSIDFCQFGYYSNINCRAAKSDSMIKKACNGKNSCQLNPSNEVYGNPCGGVVKYIHVSYKCIKAYVLLTVSIFIDNLFFISFLLISVEILETHCINGSSISPKLQFLFVEERSRSI